MKKLLALLLVLTVIFGLTACKKPEPQDPPEHVHTDDNNDGVCDGCKEVVVDYSSPNLVGKALKKSLEKQFSEAKSMKFELDLEMIVAADTWMYETSVDPSTGEETKTVVPGKSYMEAVVALDIWLSKTDSGVNAKISAKNGSKYDADAKLQYDTDETFYIIDGYAYNHVGNGYYTRNEVGAEELTETLEKLAGLELLSKEQQNELLEELGVEIASTFNILHNKGSLSFDAKPTVDKLLNYIKGIDLETTTIGDLIDDALAQISPDLTSAKIVDELERLADLTVEEALDELDEWLTENYDTTLQGIYDSIVNNPEVVSAFETILVAQGLDITDPDIRARLDEIIAQIKAFDIREALENEGINELTLFALISPALPSKPVDSENSNEYVEPVSYTKEEIFEAIRAFLDTTLAEFEEQIGTTALSSIKMIADGLTINELNAKLDLNFVGMLNLKSIDGEANLDVTLEVPSLRVEGQTETGRITVSLSFRLYDISSNPLNIALPDGAVTFNSRYTSGDSSLTVYIYSYGDSPEARVIFHIYDNSTYDYIEINEYISVEELAKNTATVKVSSCYYDYTYRDIVDQDLSFRLDHINGTFTITKLPNFSLVEGK